MNAIRSSRSWGNFAYSGLKAFTTPSSVRHFKYAISFKSAVIPPDKYLWNEAGLSGWLSVKVFLLSLENGLHLRDLLSRH
jgi:hypothetical protein